MSRGKLPRAYLNDVPDDPNTVPGMEYVPFKTMDIGARKSGMPDVASRGPNRLDHVGGSASKGGK